MDATALFVMLAWAVSATLSAQIPERAKWEITFAQVEAAAGLQDMRTARPETFEARLMHRGRWKVPRAVMSDTGS